MSKKNIKPMPCVATTIYPVIDGYEVAIKLTKATLFAHHIWAHANDLKKALEYSDGCDISAITSYLEYSPEDQRKLKAPTRKSSRWVNLEKLVIAVRRTCKTAVRVNRLERLLKIVYENTDVYQNDVLIQPELPIAQEEQEASDEKVEDEQIQEAPDETTAEIDKRQWPDKVGQEVEQVLYMDQHPIRCWVERANNRFVASFEDVCAATGYSINSRSKVWRQIDDDKKSTRIVAHSLTNRPAIELKVITPEAAYARLSKRTTETGLKVCDWFTEVKINISLPQKQKETEEPEESKVLGQVTEVLSQLSQTLHELNSNSRHQAEQAEELRSEVTRLGLRIDGMKQTASDQFLRREEYEQEEARRNYAKPSKSSAPNGRFSLYDREGQKKYKHWHTLQDTADKMVMPFWLCKTDYMKNPSENVTVCMVQRILWRLGWIRKLRVVSKGDFPWEVLPKAGPERLNGELLHVVSGAVKPKNSETFHLPRQQLRLSPDVRNFLQGLSCVAGKTGVDLECRKRLIAQLFIEACPTLWKPQAIEYWFNGDQNKVNEILARTATGIPSTEMYKEPPELYPSFDGEEEDD